MDKVTTKLIEMNGLKDDPEAIWTVGAAARFLSVKPSALEKWRRHGGGPEFVRISKTRVGYQRQAMVAWLESRKHQSTSEESVAAAAASGLAGK